MLSGSSSFSSSDAALPRFFFPFEAGTFAAGGAAAAAAEAFEDGAFARVLERVARVVVGCEAPDASVVVAFFLGGIASGTVSVEVRGRDERVSQACTI